MNMQLQRLSEELSALVGETSGRPIVKYQTGPDESVLIGTEQEILKFAQALIDAVRSAQPEVVGNVFIKGSDAIAGKLHPLGEFALDWVLVTASESDTEKVIDAAYA